MSVNCYQIRARAPREAEILIYDEIGADIFGEGVTAKQFADDLKGLGRLEQINLRINSPGGSVFDAIAIYNTLTRNPAKVIVDVDGFALSAASVVAMAGQEIRMAENGMLMIHNPHVGAYGDADEMRKAAEILDGVKNQIVTTYAARTGREPKELAAMMDRETWLDAKAAIEAGFADSISEPVKVLNKIDLAKYRNVPLDKFQLHDYQLRIRGNADRLRKTG